MSDDDAIGIEAIAAQCAEEMARFRSRLKYVTTSCYDLFRHALRDQDEYALTAVMRQYINLLKSWARGIPKDEAEAIANHAFAELVASTKRENLDFDKEFGALVNILNRLKRTVRSQVLVIRRQGERELLITDLHAGRAAEGEPDDEWHWPSPEPGPEEVIEAKEAEMLERERQRIRREILDYAKSRLNNDEQERIVWEYVILGDVAPRQAAQRWTYLFDSAAVVSTVKERLVRRCQRDSTIQSLYKNLQDFVGKSA